MAFFMGTRTEMIKVNFVVNNKRGIVYSLNKYRETEGIKDIGSHFWNFGRTQEIKDRYVHLGE